MSAPAARPCATFRRHAVTLALLIAASAAGAGEVLVHTDLVQDINGTSRIPDGLFGITAYEGASAASEAAWTATLRQSGIRWVGLPGDSRWVFGKQPAPAAGWADSAEGTQRLAQSLSGYHSPQCLRAWRDLGIEPMLYLLNYPEAVDGGVSADGKVRIPDFPRDPQAAGLMWAEYVALMRRADPQLTWVHLGNEPNAYWWKLGRFGKDWAAVYRAVALAVRARNPGIRLGGPTLCWPPSWPPAQPNTPAWYTWTQWAEPIIDQVGDQLDFFDFHLYEASPALGVEEVQTIVNALWLKTGRRIPVMVSEYGVYLKAEDLASPARVWRRRIVPWQTQVMEFLDLQPDLVLSLQPHDLFADAGGKFTFLKSRDPADQHALARAYRVWAPLRGVRLLTQDANPQVRSFASWQRDELSGTSTITIVLVNTSHAPQAIDLRLSGPALPSGPVRERFARLVEPDTAIGADRPLAEGFQDAAAGGVNGAGPTPPTDATPTVTADPSAAPDRSRIESGEAVADRLAANLVLAGDEVRSLTFPIATTTPVPARCRWRRSVFGDVVHRDLPADGAAISVRFPLTADSLRGADAAELHVGLLGARSGDAIELTINGQTLNLVADWFQRVRLTQVPASGDGTISATIRLSRRGRPEETPRLLRLGSLVLSLSGEGAHREAPASPAPPASAPARRAWSIHGPPPAAALEDPWNGAVQNTPNLPINEGLVPSATPTGRLKAVCNGGVQHSPCAALLFRAPRTGWYRVHAAGQLSGFGNPSAGHALLSIAILPQDERSMRSLAALPLNQPGGFGDHPQRFDWSQPLRLTAGWRLAFALQAVSPGPANAGAAEITWSQVEVELVEAEE